MAVTISGDTGISLATGVSGNLPVTNGGTGQTSYTDGQLLIGNTTGNTLTKATLTAGSGVTITNSTGSITIAASGGGGSYDGFKNRIINGAMVIDERNAGASVTPTDGAYTLDRWVAYLTAASKFSVQQNAGSVTPPVGFTKYLGVTSLSAYSVSSSDYFVISQRIEGFNTADLAWGTASAQTVNLSFWVRSSLTGTFGGTLMNNAGTQSYPFSYTISLANTWEQKSITITGSTTGTWETTNGRGVQVQFGLGVGSTYSATAGAWASAEEYSATGATSVVGTNGATWYVTGVQLEKGSTATSFDVRPYGTELALCQRYYLAYLSRGLLCISGSATIANGHLSFPVRMRANPTLTGDNLTRMTNAGSTDYDATFNFATNFSTVNGCSVKYTATTSTFSGAGIPVAINDSSGANTMRLYANAEL